MKKLRPKTPRSKSKARRRTPPRSLVPRTATLPAGITKRDIAPIATFLWNLSPRFRSMAQGFDSPFKQHPWIFAAVARIALNIGQVPFLTRSGDRKDAITVERGPWYELFQRINPHMDEQAYRESICIHLATGGECFIVKESKGDQRLRLGEIPFELWPMAGSLFTPRRNEAGNQDGWIYTDPASGKKIPYELWEIIPIRFLPDPEDPTRGIGPGQAAEMSARSDWKAMAFDEAFLDNDCSPGGVVQKEGPMTQEEKDDIRKSVEDKHQGFTKAFRMMLLDGGLKWIANPVSHHDMQFKEKREWTRDEILAVWGVPKSELGLEQPTNMVTGAGNVSTDRRFWSGTLTPYMTKIEHAHERYLFRPAGEFHMWVELDRSVIVALQPDLGILLDHGMKLRELGYSTNEINDRLSLGMPNIEGGDLHYMPVSMTPVEDLGLDEPTDPALEDPAPEEPPAPADEGRAADDVPEEHEVGRIVRENIQQLDFLHQIHDLEAPNELERAHAIRVVRTFLRARTKVKHKQWAGVLKKSMIPFEPRFRARLKRYFMELRAEQLKRVTKLDIPRAVGVLEKLAVGEGHEYSHAFVAVLENGHHYDQGDAQAARDTVEQVLFPMGEWNARMKTMHHKLYVDITHNAFEKVFDELGGSFAFDEADPAVTDLVAKREEILVKANDTIRRRMAREIEEGVRNKESIGQIQDRIKAAFNGFSNARSLRIARTEVGATTNQARFDAMETEGVDSTEWLTAADEAVRESHREVDGVVVPIGTTFPNGLRYPGDPNGEASEVINCRCVCVAAGR